MTNTNRDSRSPGITMLHQFAFSHFNEKARWALTWKGVTHEERNLFPGFHTRAAKRLTGRTQTPILEMGDRVVSGSAAIVRAVDQPSGERSGRHPLFPEEESLRSELDEWISWLDDEVGPATRLALFHELLDDPGYAAQIFSTGQHGWRRAAYIRLFPRMIPMLRGKMQINPETAQESRKTIDAALERIDRATQATGYLVGDRFSAADLTAAALLFPLSFPDELPFQLPEESSAKMTAWKATWSGAPAVAWMERIFAEYRWP